MGQLSGVWLGALSDAMHWFAQFNTWDDDETWGYDFNLFELSAEALRDAEEWFEEKKQQWYFNPELVALRKQFGDLFQTT